MQTLMNYRLAYLGETMVNWCAALGTVLANDEVHDGVSERGGHPVEQKKMQQWCLRVSAYAGRLLDSLNDLEWSESLKESQRNWIGKSRRCRSTLPLSWVVMEQSSPSSLACRYDLWGYLHGLSP